MPRPPRCRRICDVPQVDKFCPNGCEDTEPILLTLDEYEVVRLVDLEQQTHEQCAAQMDISRSTVQEIYESARSKIAACLVHGKPLHITGGNYRICGGQEAAHCGRCCRMQRANTEKANKKCEGDSIMKIAVTYENGQIFQHFGHTEHFKLYEAVDGKITHAEVVDTNGSGHGALAGFLMQNGVDTLICGGIGGGAQAALAEAGIKLYYGGVSGDADAAVSALLSGNLGYDPNVHCDHHDHEHGEDGHTCGDPAAASIAATDMERTLTQLPFWSSLTEQEQETLHRSAFVRHYEKGSFVHSSDNECLGMLFILSGEIRTYLLSEEGREVTLFRLYPGELCVLSASCVISQITFDTQMTAGMDTDVLIIPANVIAALKEKNLYVRCFLYELATKTVF